MQYSFDLSVETNTYMNITWYMCRYPIRILDTVSDDPRSVQEHMKAMVEEMKKSKPRDAILLPLMKSTFQDRRIFIQNEAKSVTEILEVYPALNRPAVVSLTLYFGHFGDEKRSGHNLVYMC